LWGRSAHFQQSTRVRLRDVCMPKRFRPKRFRGCDSNKVPSQIALTRHQIGIRMISS
jgi:hypothetical protein